MLIRVCQWLEMTERTLKDEKVMYTLGALTLES